MRDTHRATYQIEVQGRLDESWSDWFEGFVPSSEHGTTTFTGELQDQAALRGMLNRILDLNLTLISLKRVTWLTERESNSGFEADR